MSAIDTLKMEVLFSKKTGMATMVIPSLGIISMITSNSALLQEAIERRSHFIELENWEELSDEEIRQHPLAFTLQDIGNMCSVASVLVQIAHNEELVKDLIGHIGYGEYLATMEKAMASFAHWLTVARTLYSRHKGEEKTRACEAHEFDGSGYMPPAYLTEIAERYRAPAVLRSSSGR
jgi:hypothetical protein